MTIVVRNVGAVTVILGSLTLTGSSSNSGFQGVYQTASVATTSTLLTSTDLACTGGSAPTVSATLAQVGKGSASTITISSATACTTVGRIFSGDVVNVKITTSVGTFAQAQVTVP